MKATKAQNKSGGHEIETTNISKQVFVERKGIEMHSLRIPKKLLFESRSLILSMRETVREREEMCLWAMRVNHVFIYHLWGHFLQVSEASDEGALES